MPSSGQKGARSRLADVLADIKNSRTEDGPDCNHARPTPAKRRSAVNYVALSGQTPRQNRSNAAHALQEANRDTKANTSPSRSKSYVLKFVDYTVDLTNFLLDPKNSGREIPLYPIIRNWVQINNDPLKSNHTPHEAPQHKPTHNNQQSPGNSQISIDTAAQDDAHRLNLHKILSRQPKAKQQSASVDAICRNLLATAES